MENVITKNKNILVVLQEEINSEMQDLINRFCGQVVKNFSDIQTNTAGKRIYVCGDIAKIKDTSPSFYIIKDLSSNYENYNGRLVTLGEVPIVVSNAGVYYRKLFTDGDYFNKIKGEHAFQELTEGNKPSKAFRKGIYLTKITKDENDVLYYRLLRCTTCWLNASILLQMVCLHWRLIMP